MSAETIAPVLRSYIASNLLFTGDSFGYSDDASFLGEGIIDSVGVMELVLFVEQEFSIKVEDRDVTRENFDSVNNLSRYIASQVVTQ
jgi:acyl carrier protein